MNHTIPSESFHVDVVILGGGLAGLTLARHLLLHTDKTVCVVEKRDRLPPERQKVGESSVQVAGYYYGKVLDLEDHLYWDQIMKYNLRFYWKSAGRSNEGFEDYSAAYIRNFSNIPSYQLDRNVFEGELVRRNCLSDRFRLHLGAGDLKIQLQEEGEDPHDVRFTSGGTQHALRATWVVDASGRRRLLAKQRELLRDKPIDHGAFFWWVDGLVDIEKLTAKSNRERRMRADRRTTGHLPAWLATNHFCDEGLWFWVIPLHRKTSLGLVFDNRVVNWRDVFTVEKATEWVCERFPLFARDLPQREVLDFAGYKSFAHDCVQTIHPQRWAMTGEAGRFNDPLYSPGSDLISIHNTLIVDAIQARSAQEREERCRTYESLAKAVYQAYVPTYATSYDALGDAEAFYLKYVWELTVYFAVYVFPFINDLFTDRRFVIGFLRRFSRLGPWNRGVHRLVSGFYRWKQEHCEPLAEPVHLDFTAMRTLASAAETFFEVGVGAAEAKKLLDRQLDNLEELARFTAAHVASVVLGDPAVLRSRAYAESIDVENLDFDPAAMAARWQACRELPGEQQWTLCTQLLERFRTARKTPVEQGVVAQTV